MRNPEEDSYLIKAALFIAGAAGSFVSLYRRKVKLTWIGRVFHVTCGALTAFYLTPLFIAVLNPFFKVNESIMSSFGFLVGLLGFKAVDMLIDWVFGKFKKD